jgi:hypothetical protein
MGRRFRDNQPLWKLSWSNAGVGRYWKRQLSKSRRRYIKSFLLFGRGKHSTHYETECNYKGY